MKKVELVFVPAPGIGHFVSATEFAKRLLDRDDRFSVTILVIRPPEAPPEIEAMIQSLAASDTRIRYINIPPPDHLPPPSKSLIEKVASDFIESHAHHVKHAITRQLLAGGVQVAGLVVDMFCTSMIHDVAQQLNIPSYVFFPSGAGFLGFVLNLPLRHSQVRAEYGPSEVSIVPSYANPVPTDVLPSFAFDKDAYKAFLNHGTRFRETKGIIVNTFAELEPHAINSMKMATLPPIYPVGPLLDHSVQEKSTGLGYSKLDEIIMAWLDDQPPSSVVFLCFGSRGSFDAPQLEQIAMALERSGQRFIWSIRYPPPKDSLEMPTEYQNIKEALPEGFLERIEKRGMVCGWAPQMKILAHPATGGFISHCGWNSILESLWYGVPIATWSLYAEQQLNAFELVRELGLAVELKLDYRLGSGQVVMADVIEIAINRLMDSNNLVMNKVKEMTEKSRKAVVDGGSSYVSLGRLIEDLLNLEALDS